MSVVVIIKPKSASMLLSTRIEMAMLFFNLCDFSSTSVNLKWSISSLLDTAQARIVWRKVENAQNLGKKLSTDTLCLQIIKKCARYGFAAKR